jgi:hypothetical protein
VPYVIGHKSFGSLLASLAAELRLRMGHYFRQAWAWVKFGPSWAWAKIRGKTAPDAPRAMPLPPLGKDALYHPLPEPFYIAQAPVPEEDYNELQYDRDAPNMADVEVGQQKAVLENDSRAPFVAPVPTIQRTVTY